MTDQLRYFAQHHALEAPAINEREYRPFFRVDTRLDQLCASHAISLETWHAAIRFRRSAEIVLAQQWPAKSLDRGGNAQASSVMIARRLDAANHIRSVSRAIGAFAVRLLEWHCVDDLPWDEIGQRLNVHRKTARSWTIVALNALAMVG